MRQQLHGLVISAAKSAHKKRGHLHGEVGTRTKQATRVTKTWQNSLNQYGHRLISEYKIAKHLGEKIDMVDKVSGIAYEMKVAKNNPHMEFYKDIFKVILARDNGLTHLTRLVFLTPQKGAEKLLRSMGTDVVSAMRAQYGLIIEVVPL